MSIFRIPRRSRPSCPRASRHAVPVMLALLALACPDPRKAPDTAQGEADSVSAAPVPSGASTSLALAAPPAQRVLRVCADPNNLPFTNQRGDGFENALVGIVARELGARVEYVWWAQRRGFVRSTLRANSCDVIPGVPSTLELVTPTRPYYRSTYVFVTRANANVRVTSLDDAVLRRAKVGVQIVGDDYANSPPAEALSARGIVQNVRGYTVYGNYADTMPTAPIMRAVANGEIDVAIVWGPLAGYFARRSPVPLRLTPVSPEIDVPFLPFVYDVAMGVRHGDLALRDTLNTIIVRRRGEIDSLLAAFGVPRADRPAARPR